MTDTDLILYPTLLPTTTHLVIYLGGVGVINMNVYDHWPLN